MNDQELLESLKINSLTTNLTEQELLYLIQHSKLKTYYPGEYLMKENEKSNELYLIITGHVRLLKYDKKKIDQYTLADLFSNSSFGEISFLDDSPRSCSVITVEETNALVVSKKLLTNKNIQNQLYKNIGTQISNKLKNTNDNYIESLEMRISTLKKMIQFSQMFVIITVCLGFSSIFIALLLQHQNIINVRTAYFGWIYLLVLLAPITYLVIKNPQPAYVYGITSFNLKRSIFEALLIIAVVSPLLCWYLGYGVKDVILLFGSPVAFAYIFHSMLQEFVARGVLQTTLSNFYISYYKLTPILLAAFLFSIFHIQFGLQAVIITFLSGIVFGYIFYRQKNIFGVSLIHYVLGWLALGKLV